VLAYLARYTHRVAIANSRLVSLDAHGVSFRWKDYRAQTCGKAWIKTMTLPADEFLRRFLLHVLPSGFHRIRHYGLLAAGARADIGRIRTLIGQPSAKTAPADEPANDGAGEPAAFEITCPCCGGRMRLIEIFARSKAPKPHATVRLWADTS
jgi:hypothetical protein